MIGVAILGCGTVGAGVCRLIAENQVQIAGRLGEELRVCRVLESDRGRARALGFDDAMISADIEDILRDSAVDIVIEAMGGTDAAFRFDRAALECGKQVVTSNKDLVELHWDALHQAAAQSGAGFYFEAAVCGGIPILESLRTALAANRVNRIVGILNGTSNYILTRMSYDGLEYGAALEMAQARGFAEADPINDVGGFDAARKLAILSRLAFRAALTMRDIQIEGIASVSTDDIDTARRMGYAVKLLAVAERQTSGISAFVRPVFVPLRHPIADVNDEFNAVFLRGDAVGDLMFYGKGAGALPTASAMLGDIILAAGNLRQDVRRACPPMNQEPVILDSGTLESRFYLRLEVADRPLVLAGISTALGEAGISMASLEQVPYANGSATITIITHAASEAALRRAIDTLIQSAAVTRVSTLLCMEDEI